jgi:hypothetical protein
LTEIASLLLIPLNLKLWLGYFFGSLASCVNFYFQAKGAENRLGISPSAAKLSVFKNFYIRYLVLAAILFLIIKFLSVNIFALLVGLLAVPIVAALGGLLDYKKGERGP